MIFRNTIMEINRIYIPIEKISLTIELNQHCVMGRGGVLFLAIIIKWVYKIGRLLYKIETRFVLKKSTDIISMIVLECFGIINTSKALTMKLRLKLGSVSNI